MSPGRSMSATAASTVISRARLRCARRWRNAGSTAPARRLRRLRKPTRRPRQNLERWLRALFTAKQKRFNEDPEMFATYLTLAQEACKVVKGHKEGLIEQVASILFDGVKQGAFEIADVKTSARAVFDASIRFHHPAHSDEWKDPNCRRGSTRCWLWCLGVWKRRVRVESYRF